MPRRLRFGSIVRVGGALVALAALTACDLMPESGPRLRPAPRVDVTPEPPATAEPSGMSQAIKAHFAKTEAHLLAQGLMRRDGGGPDTPFGPRMVADTFVRIALYDEYVAQSGVLTQQETPAHLRRWQGPIRIGLRFGASVPEEDRERDRAQLATLAGRLSSLSGTSVRLSEQSPNFWVYVVSEDERPGLTGEWAALFPGLDERSLTAATAMPLSTFCMVMAISEGASPVYTGALAVIRSELGPRLRESCLHEEVTQGLGLANDYALARPSIFNDDEEFATLTRLDELLVRILYDRRLRPGQTEAEVRPILPEIVAGLMPSGS